MTINLPYFKDINLKNLDGYYDAEVEFNGKPLDIDLNFDNTEIESQRLECVRSYLMNLPDVYHAAFKAIYRDLEEGEDTIEFLDFQREDLGDEVLQELTKNADKSQPLERQILSQLTLQRIGFYPEIEEEFATLDFTIGADISNYLLVLKMDSKQQLREITIES
jgi:hypothetical protein